MTEDTQGWDGAEIPIEVQATVLMRKFRSAVHVVAQNAMNLHVEVEGLMKDVEDGDLIALKLQQHPFFMRCMNKMADSYELYGDKAFRTSSAELFAEARDELEDMITWTAFGLWVIDGAEFPEGLLEMFAEISDEEE